MCKHTEKKMKMNMKKISLDITSCCQKLSQSFIRSFGNPILNLYRIRDKKSKATDLLDKEDIIVCACSLKEARRTAYNYIVSFDTERNPFVYGRILDQNYTKCTKIGTTNKYSRAQVISYL